MWFRIISIGLTASLVLAWPDNLFAQKDNLKFERIAIEQGLSQNTIYCIRQDRKGFMWFGTQDGLNKFDGYDFKVYKHDPQNPNSLSNNVVRAIHESRDGTLWIGTNGGGLNKLVLEGTDRTEETFTLFKHDSQNPNSLSDNYVLSIHEDSRHRGEVLWIGTRYGGLNKFEVKTGRITRYQNDPGNANSLSDNYIISIYEDQAGTLWIGTYGGGLNKFDREKEIWDRYQYASMNPEDLGHNQIRTIYQDRAGTLWIGTGGGLDKLVLEGSNRQNGAITHYHHNPNDPASLSANAVWSIFEDQSGRFWIGTGIGLNQFDRVTEKFQRHHHDPDDPSSLSDNYVRAIGEDRSGMLWIGTWNGGLNKLDHRRGMFAHYRNIPNDANSLSHNNVRAIYAGRDSVLWIGTRGGGLNKFDRKKKIFTHYAEDPNGLSHNYVWSIFEDRAGEFWIGTYGDGLKKFDRQQERFTHYRHDPANPYSLSHKHVTPIYEDRTGVLWIGTDGGGLNRFDRAEETFKHYKHDANDSTSLSHDGIWSILQDRAGTLWIGTAGGGLNEFDAKSETFKSYKNDPHDSLSLSNNHVFCIHEDSRNAGILWLGTWGGGLNKFDTATGKFVHYTEKDGLPNDVIYGILEDDHGNLWLSTNKGISRFNLQTETFKNYNIHDGLQSYEFNGGAYHKSESGEMFFGGINGFNAFYPGEIKDNTYIPPLVITAFKKFDQIAKRDIAAADEIALSYRDKYLTFEFVALDYTNPEKNQYAYKMEGFDENWINAGARRFVSYTNLDPGNYVFKVKGSNNDGVWNEEGVAVKIAIAPPPWKTWWAYALYVLLVTSLLYGIRRYELNRLRLKSQLQLEHVEAEKLKELDHLKSKFFANISHEFRTPLTLILGPLENVAAKISDTAIKKQLAMAFEHGRRLLRLINQILDLSKLEAGGMELKASRNNLIPFLKGIVFVFESLAEKRRITLDFRSSYTNLEVYYDIEKMEQVFYNLISNAIKFIPPDAGGKITVTVTQSQISLLKKLPPNVECVRISIKDTGIGIPADQQPHIFNRFYRAENLPRNSQPGTGIGLALAKEIVELHFGQIDMNSEEGRGTEFIVTLPLGKDHLAANQIVEDDEPGENRLPRRVPEKISAGVLPENDHAANTESERESEAQDVILIVEDNQDVRTFIRQYLEPDYAVAEAVNGRDGFEKAAAAIPDLIICDVMMPELDGYELCHALKNDERTSHIPIILLTAMGGEENKLQGLQTGADDYLTKPFSSKELLARVENLIAQRRKLRERFSREIVLKPSEIAITSTDERFLNRVKEAVEKNLGDEEFSVEDLGREVGMSRVQLHRKLKALTGQSTGEFILSMRLQRAVDLLNQNAGTVSEIAYLVGFNTPNYFAKCFRKQFGCSPSEYKMNVAQGPS